MSTNWACTVNGKTRLKVVSAEADHTGINMGLNARAGLDLKMSNLTDGICEYSTEEEDSLSGGSLPRGPEETRQMI